MSSEQHLVAQVAELVDAEPLWVSALSNVSAHVYQSMPGVSWCGFYVKHAGELVLGPFQGPVACTRIAWGKGVCGTAAATNETQLVPNVHEFAGHIACDSNTNSEIVIPIHHAGEVVAVFDLDSHEFSRFGEPEKNMLEQVVTTLEHTIQWSGWEF